MHTYTSQLIDEMEMETRKRYILAARVETLRPWQIERESAPTRPLSGLFPEESDDILRKILFF